MPSRRTHHLFLLLALALMLASPALACGTGALGGYAFGLFAALALLAAVFSTALLSLWPAGALGLFLISILL